MAKKTKKTAGNRRYFKRIKEVNTRRQASLPKLRLSPLKFSLPLDFTRLEEPSKPVRKIRPSRPIPPPLLEGGIKNLTPSISIVSTETKREKICRRRKERKTVLHALGKTGQSGQNKPDLINSKVRC